ncbi:MAG: hypothetical protein IT240_08675 [Bacteroidia bacterium]|nr:SiaB family protein kinase [Bacteroidia bacterium]MCC6769105.1 hypothetical protein [Bacteroidia bacterium]
MFNVFDFYEKMEDGKIMLSFKGVITPDLLSSILQIMESKLDNLGEEPRQRKKVYNVLVECLQNLYHHGEVLTSTPALADKASLFLIGRNDNGLYRIITGNYILNKSIPELKSKIEQINAMNREQLKAYYLQTLNNEFYSEKGGGGLGIIDIARKSGQKFDYSFSKVDEEFSFFSLVITVNNV